MKRPPTFRSLAPSQRQLVHIMQELNFGRIEQLVVRDGIPSFSPMPRIVRELKFGGDNGPRPEATSPEFVLKARVHELLEELSRLGNGTIASLIVRDGLPYTMSVEMAAA